MNRANVVGADLFASQLRETVALLSEFGSMAPAILEPLAEVPISRGVR